MNAILSVVKNGRIEVAAPPDWPDGTPVRVELGLNGQTKYDDERPETPEEIEEWIRRFREIEPIEMTPEEEKRFMQPGENYTLEDWQRLKVLKEKITELKVELYGEEVTNPQDEDHIEKQRKKHINKRYNVKDDWIPLH